MRRQCARVCSVGPTVGEDERHVSGGVRSGLWALLVLAGLCVCSGCVCDLAIDGVAAAKTPETEAEAFRQVEAWCLSYAVEFYGRDGESIRGDELEPGCAGVHTIVIESDGTGHRVTHELLQPENVEILLLSE